MSVLEQKQNNRAHKYICKGGTELGAGNRGLRHRLLSSLELLSISYY